MTMASTSYSTIPVTAPCAVYDSNAVNASLLISQLQRRRRPAIIRGLVDPYVVKDGAHNLGSTGKAHMTCQAEGSTRRPLPLGVAATVCNWAYAHLFRLPVWELARSEGVGPEGGPIVSSTSHIGFHRHAATFNALLAGRRRWFMFDLPGCRMCTDPGGWQSVNLLRHLTSNRSRTRPSARHWLRFAYPGAEALAARAAFECKQRAGDVMYVPESMEHALISRGSNIAVFWSYAFPELCCAATATPGPIDAGLLAQRSLPIIL